MSTLLDNIVANFVVATFLFLLGLFWRPIWQMLSGLVMQLFSDIPTIAGTWTSEYTEPTEDGTTEVMNEEIRLKQVGRFVWGQTRVLDERERHFQIKGRLIRGTFVGTAKPHKRKTPSGTGTYQLQVTGNDRAMRGWCTWHDSDTDRIEASEYMWKKT